MADPKSITPSMSAEQIWQTLLRMKGSRLPELANFVTWYDPVTGEPITVLDHVHNLIKFENELYDAVVRKEGNPREVLTQRKDQRVKNLSPDKIDAFTTYYRSVAESENGARKLMLLRIATSLHDIGKIEGRGEDTYASAEHSMPVLEKLKEEGVITEDEVKLVLALIFLHDMLHTMHFGETVPREISRYLAENNINETLYYELAPLLYILDIGSVGRGVISDIHLDDVIFYTKAENLRRAIARWDQIRLYLGFCGEEFYPINFASIVDILETGIEAPEYLRDSIERLKTIDAEGYRFLMDKLLTDVSFTGHAIFIFRHINKLSQSHPEAMNNLLKLLYLLSMIHRANNQIKKIHFMPVKNDTAFAEILNNFLDRFAIEEIEEMFRESAPALEEVNARLQIPFISENEVLVIDTKALLTASYMEENRLSFILIKPDGITQRDRIIEMLQEKDIEIIYEGEPRQLTEEQAREFYKAHEGERYYEDLVRYITKGEVIPIIVRSDREDAVDYVKDIIGPPTGLDKESRKAGMRGELMTGQDRDSTKPAVENRIHGSDSVYSAVREASVVIGREELLRAISRRGPPPKVVFGIPLTAEIRGEQDRIRQAIKDASTRIPEKIEVVFFEDTGNEVKNMEYVTGIAEEKGALMAIPVRRDVNAQGLIEEIEKADFLAHVSRDLFRLINPDMARLNETTAQLMDEEKLREAVLRLSTLISPIASQKLTTLSIYNMRMTSIARQTSIKLSPETLDYPKDEEAPERALLVRTNSLGELKMIAEEHRYRKPKKLRLKIMLAVADEKELEELSNKEVLQNMLEKMDIDSDILNIDDIEIMTKAKADGLSIRDMRNSELLAKYTDENIGILDIKRDGREKDRDLLKKTVFAEYDTIVTAEDYDRTVEHMAKKEPNTEGLLYFSLPKAEALIRRLIQEIEAYKQILMAA